MTENVIHRERVIYFDVLRIAAIFFVMILHIAAENWGYTDVNTYEWSMMNIYDSISRWGVPILVMISGSLFLSRNISIERLYKKNILRLVIIFIVWSLGYSLLFNIIVNYSLKSFISGFIKGHFHLWFLYMIIGLYMITPFLRIIVEDERLTRHFLLLALAFTVIIPEIISVISVFSEKYGEWVESVVSQAHIKFVLGYSMYFVLGYYLSTKQINRKNSLLIYLMGLVGFVSTIVLTSIVSRKTNVASDIFYNNLTINVMLESVAVFVLAKNNIHNDKVSNKAKMIIAKLSKYSLGAYLLHILAITFIRKFLSLTNISFNPLFSIPIISILTFVLSFGVSSILNHIPIIKKYFV